MAPVRGQRHLDVCNFDIKLALSGAKARADGIWYRDPIPCVVNRLMKCQLFKPNPIRDEAFRRMSSEGTEGWLGLIELVLQRQGSRCVKTLRHHLLLS
jgi:hypothetical protein